VPCVWVWYASPRDGHNFRAGGGYYSTLEEAKAAIQKLLPSEVTWES
jgi:hypothetical protein